MDSLRDFFLDQSRIFYSSLRFFSSEILLYLQLSESLFLDPFQSIESAIQELCQNLVEKFSLEKTRIFYRALIGRDQIISYITMSWRQFSLLYQSLYNRLESVLQRVKSILDVFLIQREPLREDQRDVPRESSFLERQETYQ